MENRNLPAPPVTRTTPRPSGEAGQPVPDPHAGAGGSYVLDPATGVRRLVERTAEPTAPDRPTASTEE